jgi:hypothetical protein
LLTQTRKNQVDEIVPIVSIDPNDIGRGLPCQIFAGCYLQAFGARVKHLPFGVIVQMGRVGDVFVSVLFQGQLFVGMGPRVEAYFTALRVKGEVFYHNDAAGVNPHFWYPCDHSSVRYPRVEVLHFDQIVILADTLN